ncbi:MAG: ABC transporter permease [Chloroflexota bacterium]|nr:MAG: ABC transporter permease [Chloroflexota bacterium]
MTNYIIRRLLLFVPTLLLVTIIVFCAVRFVPGNVIELMAAETGEAEDLEASIEIIKHRLGLDVPIHEQYLRWLGGICRLDLGTSLWTNRSISEEITSKLPVSFELGILAIITALLIALPIGIFSAIRQDTSGDYIGRTIAILCISVPGFWLATMVIVYPSIWFGWTPPMEYTPFFKDPLDNMVQFMVPAIIMGLVLSGTTMRMMRTMMLEVLRQDYIRTAWSKGLKEQMIIFRHALKNALIPVITIVGLQVPILVGGTVIIETIFGLPGIGRYFIEALSRRDYPVISAVTLMVSAVVMLVNLVVDMIYAYLDPRVQYT